MHINDLASLARLRGRRIVFYLVCPILKLLLSILRHVFGYENLEHMETFTLWIGCSILRVNEQWRLLLIRLLFAVFCFFSISEASVRAPRARHQTTKLVGEFTCIPTHTLAPVSAPQTTPRTVNMCGNILPRFFPLDDRGDRTNQLHWLDLLDTWYISLLNQTVKGRVFYSADKCFETEADPRNIFDKQSLKFWTPCLSAF